MSVKHNDLCRQIRLYLSKVGILSIDTPTPGLLFTKSGIPVKSTGKGKLDIHACAPMTVYDKDGTPYKIGVYLSIDAKVGKDRLKTEQANYAKVVERHGGIAFAAYSVSEVRDTLIKRGILDENSAQPDGD